ncbi:MAG: serine hydrolase [bacterium]
MEKLKQSVKKATSEKIFSGIGIEVNYKGKNVLSLYDGKNMFEEKGQKEEAEIITPSHFFDLASLTKPLCTSLLTSILVDKGCLAFDTKISDIMDEFSLSYNKELSGIKIENLLNHSSGLDAWMQIYNTVKSRSDAYMLVRSKSLAYSTGSKNLYSDLGYILLGELLEITTEHKLNYLFEHFVTSQMGLKELCFIPISDPSSKDNKKFVSSGFSEVRNKQLIGEVNDENTFVFNGIAGHAGLFGTARNVCSLAQELLNIIEGKSTSAIISKETLLKSLQRTSSSSEWGYGWHYPSGKDSTGGKNLSKNSIGMNGFTGTSIWIDIDNSLVITILTNRTIATDAAKFGGIKDRFSALRPLMHDIITGELI